MKRKKLIYGLAGIVAIALWAAFRPERLFLNAKVNEAMPAGLANVSQTVLTSGSFHSVAHESKGTASIYQLPDGKRILRFTNFETSNGPDVHVYLVAANDASDSETVKNAGFVELGSLKGNIGDQNYGIPADLELPKMGIYLTPVTTTCSVFCPWRIIREICWNWRPAFRPRQPAGNICCGCAGPMDFVARAAVERRVGRKQRALCDVQVATTRFL